MNPQISYEQETPPLRGCAIDGGTRTPAQKSYPESDFIFGNRPNGCMHTAVRYLSRVLSSCSWRYTDAITKVQSSIKPSGIAVTPALPVFEAGAGESGQSEFRLQEGEGDTDDVEFAVGIVSAVEWSSEDDCCEDEIRQHENAGCDIALNQILPTSRSTKVYMTVSVTSRISANEWGNICTSAPEVDDAPSDRFADDLGTITYDELVESLNDGTCEGRLGFMNGIETPIDDGGRMVANAINRALYSNIVCGNSPMTKSLKTHHAYCDSFRDQQKFLHERTDITFSQFIAGTIDILSLREEYILYAFELLSGHQPLITSSALISKLGAFQSIRYIHNFNLNLVF